MSTQLVVVPQHCNQLVHISNWVWICKSDQSDGFMNEDIEGDILEMYFFNEVSKCP